MARGAARDYILELIKNHYYRFEIGSDNRKPIFFRDFIKNNREHEFNIYETLARDIIVHPLPFHLDYAPPKKRRASYNTTRKSLYANCEA